MLYQPTLQHARGTGCSQTQHTHCCWGDETLGTVEPEGEGFGMWLKALCYLSKGLLVWFLHIVSPQHGVLLYPQTKVQGCDAVLAWLMKVYLRKDHVYI